MSIQPDIAALLDKHLGKWADEQGIPVSWDNVEFTPPETGVYLQSHDLPATPYSIDLAGTCLVFPGVYQINVIAKSATGRTLAAQTAKKNHHTFFSKSRIIRGRLFLLGNIFPGYPSWHQQRRELDCSGQPDLPRRNHPLISAAHF